MSGLFRQLCADPEAPRPAKHPYGAGQVLESEPVRFEHRDLVDFAPSPKPAESILDGLNGYGYGQKVSNLSLAQQHGHHKELAYET